MTTRYADPCTGTVAPEVAEALDHIYSLPEEERRAWILARDAEHRAKTAAHIKAINDARRRLH